MHNTMIVRIRRGLFLSLLSGIIFILFSINANFSIAYAQHGISRRLRTFEIATVTPDTIQLGMYYTIRTFQLPDGTIVDEQKVGGPSSPPLGFNTEQQSIALPKSDNATESAIGGSDSPAYVLGCSSTAAGDIAIMEDRGEYPIFKGGLASNNLYGSMQSVVSGPYYPNLYTGPTNGGVMPLDNSLWPTWTDVAGGLYSNNPLIASHNGVDGRVTRGTIDNYWVSYESTAPDPYISGGWTPGPPETIGDYMKTGQSAYNNPDGTTTFYTYNNSTRPFSCDKAASENLPDGSLGRKLFYESRGYAVSQCYNQPTEKVSGDGGFTYAQYRAEIDSGRPVMLGLQGHNVVGIGYNPSSNQIYIHDGWDYNMHTMIWGGSYAGFPMIMVSMVNPVGVTQGKVTISGYAGVPNATITYTGGVTKASISGYYSFSVAPGWSGRVTPSKPGYTFSPQYKNYSNIPDYQTKQNYTATIISGSNLLKDPSFELGTSNPYWSGSSTHFGTPLCDASCGPGARTGSVWGWFGGIASNEVATLSQTVTIPRGTASLDFYLWIGDDTEPGSDTTDVFTAKIDGKTVFSANATQINLYPAYIPVSVDVSAYADGGSHILTFASVTSGQIVSFNLDDVAIMSNPIAIINPQPIKGDFNGDGRDETGIFSSGNGTWFIKGVAPFVYGQSGDIPVPADYNGDGKDEIAVFRPSSSTWYIRGMGSFLYGTVGDIPVVADYNGDRKADIAVFRPTNSTWYILGVGPRVYGKVGDTPVVADYNGDGKADVAVFRSTNSTWYIQGIGPRMYGIAGDVPVVADYNGDGKADVAVFRSTNSTWYIQGIGPRVYGMVGDIPVIGDYTGDGKADITVFRPSSNIFYIQGVGPVPY